MNKNTHEIAENIILKIKEAIEDDSPFLSFSWHIRTTNKINEILKNHNKNRNNNGEFWKEAYNLLKPDLIEKFKIKLNNEELEAVTAYEQRLEAKIKNLFSGYRQESKFLKKYFDTDEFGKIVPMKPNEEGNYSLPSLDNSNLSSLKTFYSKTLFDITETGRVKIEIQDVGDEENINHIIRIFTPEYCDMFKKTLYNKVFEGGELTDEEFEKLFDILKIEL